MLIELHDEMRQLRTLRDELTENDQRTIDTGDRIVVNSRVDLELYKQRPCYFLFYSGTEGCQQNSCELLRRH